MPTSSEATSWFIVYTRDFLTFLQKCISPRLKGVFIMEMKHVLLDLCGITLQSTYLCIPPPVRDEETCLDRDFGLDECHKVSLRCHSFCCYIAIYSIRARRCSALFTCFVRIWLNAPQKVKHF